MNEEQRLSGGCISAIAIVVIVAVISLFVGCETIRRVEPGQAGVLVDFGAGTSTGKPSIHSVATAQYVFINPITQKVVAYPIGQQTLTMVRREQEGQVKGDDSVSCQDTNGIPLSVDSSVFWRADPDHAGDLYLLRPDTPLVSKDGNDISSLMVRREVRNAVTIGCSRYRYDQIFGKEKVDFGRTVGDVLQENLKRTYILLDSFVLGEIHLNPDQQAAINRKALAEQAALEAAFLQKKAENEALAVVAKANGQKQARIKEAEGEAEAIRLVQERLAQSREYIAYIYATRWDGKYPTTLITSGENAPSLILPVQPAANPPAPAQQPSQQAAPSLPPAQPAPASPAQPKKPQGR